MNAQDYTGRVQVAGPADRRALEFLTIDKLAVGAMDNNAYLLTCVSSGLACLIDAAADADRLLGVFDIDDLDTVVTTHRHADHWGALPDVMKVTGARTAAGADDAAGIPVPTDVPLRHGEELTFGGITLHVVGLVGHTPGSVALRYDDPSGRQHLFTGDSLFPGGPGNTDRDPARFTSLMDDLEVKVFEPLPDSTWVYPGHGADTTLGAERPHLKEWRARGW